MAELEGEQEKGQTSMSNAEGMKNLGSEQPIERHSSEHTAQQVEHITNMALDRAGKASSDLHIQSARTSSEGYEEIGFGRRAEDNPSRVVNTELDRSGDGVKITKEVAEYRGTVENGQGKIADRDRKRPTVELDDSQTRHLAADILGHARREIAEAEIKKQAREKKVVDDLFNA